MDGKAGPVSGTGGAASGLSIASLALSAIGTMDAAKGVKAGDDFKAAELDRAAQYGDLKAEQTGGQLTMRLNQTLGNIDAIRAASHTDPSSPSSAAYRDFQENVGVNQKNITVDSILAQSTQNEADAAYLRKAGADALLAGNISAFGKAVGAVGQGFKGGGGSGGGKSDPDVDAADAAARSGGGP